MSSDRKVDLMQAKLRPPSGNTGFFPAFSEGFSAETESKQERVADHLAEGEFRDEELLRQEGFADHLVETILRGDTGEEKIEAAPLKNRSSEDDEENSKDDAAGALAKEEEEEERAALKKKRGRKA
jgi:hypothetical protein